jgi:predicted nuclease of predicted toxin-antitoxin system
VKFLVDAQLPPALARWLLEAGYEAQAVREIGLREADDGAIWRHAEATGCVIVTKDEDFSLRVQAIETGPCVVWLRVGNTSNAALREWFVPRMPQIEALLARDTRLVEIR